MILNLLWPTEFDENVSDFSNYSNSDVLSLQLCAWGNVFAGAPPHQHFFNVMDAASKVTGAFTPEQCSAMFDIWLAQQINESRKNRKGDDT